MEWVSGELQTLVYHLLPGFLAAWVFYGLTAHPKKDAFERIVQALIFTVIVKAINIEIIRKIWWHYHADDGVFWTEEKELVCSVLVAVFIGVLFAACANWNVLHWLLQKLRITKRTSYPSEWYSAFHRVKRYVILHLEGERRLKGWPEEWPDQPDRGHFLILDPQWVDDSGCDIPLVQTERILVPASMVSMVEMVRWRPEVKWSDEQIKSAQKRLLELHAKGASNGSKASTESATKPLVATDDAAASEPEGG